MPLYEYECTQCKRHIEKIQKFSDPEITACPHCGGKLERVISAAAISFKGGGWFKDGYGNAKPAPAADSKSDSAAPSASSNTDSSSNKDSGNSGGSSSKDSGSSSKDSGSSASKESTPAAPSSPSPAPAASPSSSSSTEKK